MEFGIEKCPLLIKKNGKRKMTERIELPNQEKIRTLGENIFRNIESGPTIKQTEMKEKIEKAYFRRTIKLHETKLYSRNLIWERSTCAVPLVRYSGPFLTWLREEFQQMNKKTHNKP